jgi:hypothetical protein
MSLDQILLIPGIGDGPPAPPSGAPALLQETGDFFLLEDGSGVLSLE